MEKDIKDYARYARRRNKIKMIVETEEKQKIGTNSDNNEYHRPDKYSNRTDTQLERYLKSLEIAVNNLNRRISKKLKEEHRKLSKAEKDDLLIIKKNL